MTHFVYDDTSIGNEKVDKQAAPANETSKHLRASDWNSHRQALLDLKAQLRGARWIGFDGPGLAADPEPAGVDSYLWKDDTGKIWLKHDGENVSLGDLPDIVGADTLDGGSLTFDAKGRITSIAGKHRISVKSHGAVGDGATDDTAAIQAAHAAAVTIGAQLHFPPGTYKLVSVGAGPGPDHCLLIADAQTDVQWVGDKATLTWDTFVGHGVYIGTDVQRVSITGIKFQGRNDAVLSSRWEVNQGYAFYVDLPSIDLAIEGCHFDHVSTVFYRASDNQTGGRLLFSRNVVTEAPASLNGPCYTKIVDNWFMNEAIEPTRSHGIYLFGHTEKVIIRGNHFKNIATSDIKINATDAHRLQKRGLLISDNIFEKTGHNAITLGTAQTVNLGSIIIANNLFKNCNGAMTLEGAKDCTITGNLIECDYDYPHSPIGGYAIAVTTLNNKDTAENVKIADNVIRTRHPFWAMFKITAEPNDGDTVTVGAVTYTWRTVPAAPGDVQRSAGLDGCAGALAAAINGTATGPGAIAQNVILRDFSDCFASAVFNEGLVVIASENTFAVASTGANGAFVTRRADLSLASDPVLGGDNQLDTWIEAVTPGTGGNDITIAGVADGAGAGNITRAGTDFTYHYEADVSTVADFETLVGALVGGDALIQVKRAGTAAQVLSVNTAFGAIHLTNGRDEVVDMNTVNVSGVLVADAKHVSVENNKINCGGGGGAIVLQRCFRPRVIGNEIINTPYGISSVYSVFPYYESNRLTIINNKPGLPNNLDYRQILIAYDAFPVIRNMDILGRVAQYEQQNTLPFLTGNAGVVPIGDGKAHGYLFFGAENGVDNSDAGAQLARWKDGDQFVVLDDFVVFTFTFMRTIGDATTEFNDYASLMNLINTQTGGNFTASNPVLAYFGADPLGSGFMEVKSATAGVRPCYMAVGNATKRMSLMNGVILRKSTEGDTFSYMAGDAAAATKTAVFTPLASKAYPLIVQGVDAASQALNPIAYQADTIPGVCYVITHDAAVSGNEKFFFKVGN